jgi:hypothetical protein
MSGEECREIERLLIHQTLDILDEETRNRVLAHVAKCPDCLNRHEQISVDMEKFLTWSDATVPEGAVAFVLGEAANLMPAPSSPPDEPATESASAPSEASSLLESLADLENLMKTSKARPAGLGSSTAARAASGALSEQDRDLIRKELGLDDIFDDDDDDDPPAVGDDEPSGEFGDFEKMARAAEKASASKRMRRGSDEQWQKMTGTTIVNPDDIEHAAAQKDTGDTGEWAEKARTDVMPSEVLRKKAAEESFMGTTILNAAGAAPKHPTKRFSSVVLANIKTVAPEKRARRKKMRKVATVSPAVLFSVGLHVAAVLALGIWVWVIPKDKDLLPVRINNNTEELIEEHDDIKEEVEVDVEEIIDFMKDADPSEKEDPADTTDSRPTSDPIGIASDTAPPTPVHRNDNLFKRRSGGGGGGGGTYLAVDWALHWFAQHQDDDGKWHHIDYVLNCKRHTKPPCNHGISEIFAKERRNFTPGITGLVTLCFLGAGYTHTDIPAGQEVGKRFLERHGRYRPVVRNALKYLVRIQTSDGCFGPKKDLDMEGYMYNHGICSLAVLEAYHLTGDEKLLAAGEKALAFIAKAQNPISGGWDYVAYSRSEPRRDRSDTSVSSWQVMALKAAIDAGVRVDNKCWIRARRFFQAMNRSRGRFYYARGKDVEKENKARNSQGVNSASLLSLMYLWKNPLQSRVLHAGAMALLRDLPNPDRLLDSAPAREAFNFHSVYYWYYGTLVMYNLGGEYWHSWKDSLTNMLKQSQVQKGNAKGTWDPKGAFLGKFAGRLYVTAFNVLNLEVDYRYLPMYKKIKVEEPKAEPSSRKQLSREQLLTLLRNRKKKYRSQVRAAAMRELARRFGRDKEVLAALDRHFARPGIESKAKTAAIAELCRRHASENLVLAVLARVLLDSHISWTAKNSAYRALKGAGRQALPFVRNLVLQVDDETKKLIILILKEQKDSEAVPMLETLVATGHSKGVRRAAEEAIGAIRR